MVSTVAILLSLVALSQAGVLERNNPRIVNGENAKPGEIPYQVSLQYQYSSFHFCGGSIFNERYVITAAHCVVGASPYELKVIAGTLHLDEPQSVHEVEEIIVHENYQASNSWFNDIALIKVKTPFEKSQFVSFVPLPELADVTNAQDVATVSGWGRIWLGGPSPKHLQRADIFIADHDYCRNIYKPGQNVHDSQICAYDPTESRGACNGDSGGPLTVKGKLVGIVSWSRGCALTDYPTVYTRVTSYLDWIAEHTS